MKSKGQANPHREQPGSEQPEVHFDYGYLGSRDSPGQPCVMGRDTTTGAYVSTMVDRKGRISPYAIAHLVGWARGLGHRRITVRSDNEPAILSLLTAVSAEVSVEWVPKTSPEYDHQANGAAEAAVREMKAQTRTVVSQLETSLGAKLGVESDVLSWACRYAANCVNRYRIGSDGETAEQRRTGRKWRRPTVGFGERCYYRPAAKPGPHKNAMGEERMKEGTYVGHHERSGAALFLTPSGLQRGVGIHRLPESTRWDVAFVKQCKGLPWDVRALRPIAQDNELAAVIAPVSVMPLPPAVPDSTRKRRRPTFYVTRADVTKYGPTDECPACVAMSTGQPMTGGQGHSEACKKRFGETLSKETEDDNPGGV